MIYAQEEKQESPLVSVNTIARGRTLQPSAGINQANEAAELDEQRGTKAAVQTGEHIPSNGGVNPAIQLKTTDVSLENEEIPTAGVFVNELGIVAPEANLRPAPSTDNQPLKLLAFNTKVQIIKELGGDWSYISTEEGDTGYVASYLIKKGLPEPGAVLHKIESGESAIGIAERYYGENANRWGRDLRYYVNVLVHVNGGEGDATKGIYTPHAGAGWRETQVRSGYYIWVPSPGFANSLQGVVESGSITYGIKEGIDNTIDFFRRKLNDFKYANQFVGQLLPQKLSDDLLGAIKSALLNFALGMIAAGLLLAITAGLGAVIGALAGLLAGGVGAAPGAALGTKIGFEIGLFLLKWIGLGLLVTYGVSLLGRIGIAFGEYVIAVWKANGDRRELENSADLCAEAIKEFLLSVLELVIMLVAAWGVGRAMGALANTKIGRRLGYDRLLEWVKQRSQNESIKRYFGEKNKWIDEQGNINWPPNRGFKKPPEKIILQPGTRVDRYGYEGGTFVSPEGTPYSHRSLAPGTERKPYNIYEVLKPVEVESGEIAPWFGSPGGGIQYVFNRPIIELIEAGILKRVGP